MRLTGWATAPAPEPGPGAGRGPGPEPGRGCGPPAGLEPLYGLAAATPLRAPHGTAFARWVRVPALEGEVRGSGPGAVCAALAWLGVPADAEGAGGAEGVGADGRGAEAARPVVRVTDGSLGVGWAGGGVRLTFDPLTVTPYTVEPGCGTGGPG